MKKIIENNFLNEEIAMIKRARNHKSHKAPKGTNIITYKNSTGLEALIGYLYLNKKRNRIEEIMKYIVGD
ncbi:MAG: ribonuclease III domain-containing protein [Bacilli bacterium]